MTSTIESIDLQIEELQEQRRQLVEAQNEEDDAVFDVTELVTAANQRLHQVLIDAGVKECDVLSINTNQLDLRKQNEMIKLYVINSDGIVILNRFFSAKYIYQVIDEIVSSAVAIEEVNRRFKSRLKAADLSQNSIHLVTEREQLDVYLRPNGNDTFDVNVDQEIKLIDLEEIYIRSETDSNAFLDILGLNLSADFCYRKDNVAVSELEDVLTKIDEAYKHLSVSS